MQSKLGLPSRPENAQRQHPKVALRWTPPGKRKRGRPKMTWRETVMVKLKEKGLSWGEAQASAKDRILWRNIVVALCPTGDEEDK